MSLLRFWPTEADCLQCIKPEAENPSDAVFLAVHQEMRFVRKSFHTKQAEKKSQRQLLNEFLRDEPSRRVILPILGESGIGKSHLVRWLDVQLRQLDDRETRHVIRIPKGSSLKSVLGRILDGLEGTRYEEIHSQLKSAREQLDDISAKERIRAELLTAIERKYKAASERKAVVQIAGGTLSADDKLWLGHGDPRALPALLKDPATEALFVVGTASRPGIIVELARHLTKDTSETESPRRQFERADFLIPMELADNVREAGPIAGTYLAKLQRTTSTQLLDEVVDLLNSVVNDAIAPLVTPPDTSLSELFYEVRRQLLADGKELILLVEDFAVLVGVQKALLDAIIREGEANGKIEACMIRTALAVTDGYFGNLETVESRAVHGWWVECGEGETERDVTNQIGNFVAAYVNAARIGAKRLESHYKHASNVGKKAPNATEFITPEEDEQALLASFGQSADGYSLFPFNQKAIRAIVDWRLKDQQGRLKFHPRSVINEVILPVLKDARVSFEQGAFPPEHFLGYPKTKISPDLTTEVSRKESDLLRRDRYLYLFEFWAGCPDSLADAQIPTGVFSAFGLSVLGHNTNVAGPKPLKPLTGTDKDGAGKEAVPSTRETGHAEVATEKEAPVVRQFLEKINEWRGGAILGQIEANRIRGWINTHILHSINWEAELLRPVKPATNTYATSIYLPRAKGNPPSIDKSFLVVAEDAMFEDASVANSIFNAIRAMLRYEHHNGWDYKDADNDYIALATFIVPRLSQAVDWIRVRYKNLDSSPVVSLTQSLLWQARILNVETAHRSDDVSHIDAIFAPLPKAGNRDNDEEWNEFLDEMASKRSILMEELLERVAAFQGTGKTPHAVDASQLHGAIQELRNTWKVDAKFPQPPSSAADELKEIERHINLLIRTGVAKVDTRAKKIAEQSKAIIGELGVEYDKNEMLKDIAEVCALVEQYGLKGEIPVGDLRKLSEQFKDARAKETGEQVDAIVTSNDLGSRMSAIAKLDVHTHALLVAFSETCARFLRERMGKAQGRIVTWTEAVVESKKAVVDEVLQDLEDAVAPYRKANS